MLLPKVSVLMVTYNHERFIEQAVRSALMQEVDFPYEIVIGEDCSTDRTRDVLLRLAAEHPDRVQLILRERNIGAIKNFRETLTACRGEYIAILEGDDYWTNPAKLQKQVDALDCHPTWTMCFHATDVLADDADAEVASLPDVDYKDTYTLADILEKNFIATVSTLYRKATLLPWPEWLDGLAMGDWPANILAARSGSIGFLPITMAVYRIHSGGVWSSRCFSDRLHDTLKMFFVFDRELGPEAGPVFARAGQAYLTNVVDPLNNAWSLRIARLLGRPFEWLRRWGGPRRPYSK